MTAPRLLIALLVLASCAWSATRGTGKVLGDRMADSRSTGTTAGNVILNVPIPTAPGPTSRNPVPAPSATNRIVIVEIGDFIYDWQQVKGPRFTAIPDDPIEFSEDKGKYTVRRAGAVYEFIVVDFRRK